ncbi:MAG TPA: LCP family protein [Candidatus Pullichristensenella avicola]|nr:LCP family protein [Candidatus Pullichristensenella avicola]
MKKTFQAVLAAMLALLLTLGSASAVMVDDEGYLEEILLEEGDQIEFYDEAISDSLEASLAKVNEMSHILLLGIDARPGQTTGRTDTMIILTVDTQNQKIKLMSLMRDIIVQIPGRDPNRLNAAYVFGGADLLLQTIEANFGIHIDHYVGVNFSMLADLIDQIGGLTLTVESEYYMDRINAVIKEDNKVLGIDENDGLLTQAGEQHMTGKQAQAYARYRYGTSDGDFGRTARQREVITKIFERLTEMSLTDLSALAMTNINNVVTNLTLQDIMLLAPAMLSLKDAEIEELRIPVDNGYQFQTVRGMSVIVPDRTKTMEAIAAFLTDAG